MSTSPKKPAGPRATSTTKKTAARPSRSRATTARPKARTIGTRRRRTTGTAASRRRQPALPATVGSALGMVIVTFLLDTSWPVRIGLLVLVLGVGLAWILWQNRAEIGAGAREAAEPMDQPELTDPTSPESPNP